MPSCGTRPRRGGGGRLGGGDHGGSEEHAPLVRPRHRRRLIFQKVDGVTGKCDRDAGTISITAKDRVGARGPRRADRGRLPWHDRGQGSDDQGRQRRDQWPGQVADALWHPQLLQLVQPGINSALGTVKGVTGATAKPRSDTFEVTGDFDAEEVVNTLSAAGFHVKVKKYTKRAFGVTAFEWSGAKGPHE
jgi:hypothetical protein